ncbi:hypothetical protein QBC39DRAFT_338228 [Podospora conica]|nr:hypothetical protein QBC39DRAFT_338228 [Schizothecium conicum]
MPTGGIFWFPFRPPPACQRGHTGAGCEPTRPSNKNCSSNGDAGFSSSTSPVAKAVGFHAVSQEMGHSGMAPLQALISLRQGKVGGGVPRPNSNAHCDVDVGPGVESSKSRISLRSGERWMTQLRRSTGSTAIREQNIIACRCPDLFNTKRQHSFQTPRGHPILQISTAWGQPQRAPSIRSCRSELVSRPPGLDNVFSTSAVPGHTGKQVWSDCALCDRLLVLSAAVRCQTAPPGCV